MLPDVNLTLHHRSDFGSMGGVREVDSGRSVQAMRKLDINLLGVDVVYAILRIL